MARRAVRDVARNEDEVRILGIHLLHEIRKPLFFVKRGNVNIGELHNFQAIEIGREPGYGDGNIFHRRIRLHVPSAPDR